MAKGLNLIKHSLNINVKRYFTDVNGTIVIPPLALQVKYPFFMLGSFDMQGGYKSGIAVCPPEPGTHYLLSFVNGINFGTHNIVGFSGLNQVQNFITVGDIVHVYTDDVSNPNYFIWIVQQHSIVSLGSIIRNTATTSADNKFNRLFVDLVKYTTGNTNVDQWNEPIHLTRVNNIGLYRDDSYNPTANRPPSIFLNDILDLIDIKPFMVDQFFGLNTYIRYSTTNIQFIFKLKI